MITQGGTLADFRGYIEHNGGSVIAASVLMGKPHSAKLAITKPTRAITQISWKKFGGLVV
jgi:hypothetical protein